MTLRAEVRHPQPLVFESPIEVWAPADSSGALSALARVDEAIDAGYWIAGALSYELGAALHGTIGHAPETPLLILGVFNAPSQERREPSARLELSAPLPRIAFDPYANAVREILRRIRDGDVYQVNYTVPFDLALRGEPYTLYRFLEARSAATYSAYVEHGGFAIASISPELFLRFEGDRLTTKPMKGTATLDRLHELENKKNRAEHLMIVDLLRNDLHRICGDVSVRDMFAVERYPTFATMTSTIEGTLRSQTPFLEIMRAMFPCGSITGAPKRAAMQYIAQTESQPRGFYTGSIGFLSPQRRGWWNVAIRTLQCRRDTERARFDAGGGIVTDSNAAAEWNEIAVKMRFLRPAYEGFELWETLRCGPNPSDAESHLDRLGRSATAFGIPVDLERIRARLTELNARDEATLVRVRVAPDAGLSITGEPLAVTEQPVHVCVSSQRVRSGDPFLAHKTSWRPPQHAAAQEARNRDCFDALLQNERGELTEGSRTTLFIEIDGRLYTPPLHCGVLPGVLRARLLREGRAAERILYQRDLHAASAVYLGNSARGLIRAALR